MSPLFEAMMQVAHSGSDDSGDHNDWNGWKPDFAPALPAGKKAKKTPKNNVKTARTPHQQQESHSPSAAVALHGTEKADARRRIVDARLWDGMTPVQQDAALEVALAFETMGRGLGYVTSDWQRIPGCRGAHNAVESHGRLIRGYVEWTVMCAKAKVSHSMIIDILVFGFSCRALDRDRRVAAGFSRNNLLEGLSLYADMKGWPRG
ncbi:MAG: hypothetical protein PW788_02160 [Micavibrio sp.]|nr:hypothetical protein [Micavibrio sp.]